MAETVVTSPHGDITVTHPDGATPDEIISYAKANYKPEQKSSTAYDVAASGAAGVGKGTAGLLGLPADAANAFAYYRDKYITNPIVGALGGTQQTEEQLSAKPEFNKAIGSENIQKQMEKVTGEFHKPETTAGKYAENVGEFIPGAIAAPGGVVTNAIRYGVLPGLASEAAGQATAGTSYEPWARAGAGIAAGLINPSRAVTPLPASDMRNRMVQALKGEGVTSLTAGQKTGNEGLRYMESAASAAPMAGGGAAKIQGEGQRQFTEAVMRRAGAGPDASPEVLAANQERLGRTFDDLSARNSVKADPQLATDLGQTLREYDKVLPAAQKQIVGNLATDIVDKFTAGGGVMSGVDYQAARSRLSKMSKNATGKDDDFADALRGMRDALDNGMSRSVSPADREAWLTARKEYGAQKTIETAASRAGEATAEGQITPPNLRNTVAAKDRGAYARGSGDFAELARAGASVMTPLPNSGTAQRMNAFNILGILNGATAGAIPAVTGRALMSKPMQDYLSNQLIHGNVLPSSPAAQRLLIVEMLQKGLLPQPSQQSPQVGQ